MTGFADTLYIADGHHRLAGAATLGNNENRSVDFIPAGIYAASEFAVSAFARGVTDDDIEMEYARMAMQYGQKAKDIRKIYEQNDAVAELLAGIRKSKAMDWLLHHVEMVDHEGKAIDSDLIIGHSHDDEDDHDHDHDDHDHADDESDS